MTLVAQLASSHPPAPTPAPPDSSPVESPLCHRVTSDPFLCPPSSSQMKETHDALRSIKPGVLAQLLRNIDQLQRGSQLSTVPQPEVFIETRTTLSKMSPTRETERRGPVMASIATVVIDTFESTPAASPALPAAQIPTGVAAVSAAPKEATTDYTSHLPQQALPALAEGSHVHVEAHLGGSALYSVAGARLWLDAPQIRTLVDQPVHAEGSGLSAAQQQALKDVGDQCWVPVRRATDVPTSFPRNRIRYEGEKRLFEWLKAPSHRHLEDLLDTPLYGAEYLHVAPPDSPQDVHALIAAFAAAPTSGPSKTRWIPKIVYEPPPMACHPGQKGWLEKILKGVHVISPNHEELFAFYNMPKLDIDDPAFPATVEERVKYLLDFGVGESGLGIVLVRCSKLGCCVGTRSGGIRWLPAFFSEDQQDRIIDPTGAGNAFLGGYIAGLHLTGGDAYKAAEYATVSASFMIEQRGLPPILSSSVSGPYSGSNGGTPFERLREYQSRSGSLD